jgi:outer membrane protein
MGSWGPSLLRLGVAFLISIHLCLAQAQTGAPDKAAILNQAKQLMAAQKPQEAYQLLLNAESRFGGNADFDLYLGRAALASNKPAEAVFALERALAVKPDFPQARAELGRAYFYLGENAAAKAELSALKQQNLPPAVEANVQKFLDAIQSRFDASGRRLEFYVKAGGGNDSNINSAPDLTEIEIPLFAALGPAPLNENSRELESAYAELEPGIRFSTALSNNLNLHASADVNLREASEVEEFSTRVINGVVGLGLLAGSNQFRAALALQAFGVNDNTYREQAGINLEWQKSLDANDRLTVFIQYADLSYPELEFRDGDQTSGGITWLHAFRSGVFYTSAYAGDEGIDDEERQFLAREFSGARIGGQINWGRHLIYTNLNFLSSEYGEEDALFLVTRKDDYSNLELGMQIFLASTGRVDWRLIPAISASTNESNISVYEYDRTAIGINARADF